MKCEACHENIDPIIVAQHKLEDMSIVRCPDCDLIFIKPLPDKNAITEYYNGMYMDLSQSFSEQKYSWAKSSMYEYLKEVKKINNNCSTFLDLGGGLGYYSRAASELGLTVTLVEPDPVSAAFASKHHNRVSVAQCTIQNFIEKHHSHRFDIVFFRHAIEHLEEPSSMVKIISELLSENGVLIIETPNNKSIEFLLRPSSYIFFKRVYGKFIGLDSWLQLFRSHPYAIDPPRHLHCFNVDNLTRLLNSYNLQVEKSITYRMGHPIYWPNILLPKLNDFFTFKVKKIAASVIELFSLPVRVGLQAFGYGSGICMYAQKKAKLTTTADISRKV